MLCFIYKSLKKDELYVYLDTRDDFSKVPEVLINSFSPLQFVMELELTADRKLAREDTTKVLNALSTKGYFIQMPPVLVSTPEKLQ